mmetsp:Transcript_28866/g.93932  ORF Transcript_28866/g.93932 Transcript_28866/m.93932 type:complete len:275 (-) Transcript_28866:312-1136(-)
MSVAHVHRTQQTYSLSHSSSPSPARSRHRGRRLALHRLGFLLLELGPTAGHTACHAGGIFIPPPRNQLAHDFRRIMWHIGDVEEGSVVPGDELEDLAQLGQEVVHVILGHLCARQQLFQPHEQPQKVLCAVDLCQRHVSSSISLPLDDQLSLITLVLVEQAGVQSALKVLPQTTGHNGAGLAACLLPAPGRKVGQDLGHAWPSRQRDAAVLLRHQLPVVNQLLLELKWKRDHQGQAATLSFRLRAFGRVGAAGSIGRPRAARCRCRGPILALPL